MLPLVIAHRVVVVVTLLQGAFSCDPIMGRQHAQRPKSSWALGNALLLRTVLRCYVLGVTLNQPPAPRADLFGAAAGSVRGSSNGPGDWAVPSPVRAPPLADWAVPTAGVAGVVGGGPSEGPAADASAAPAVVATGGVFAGAGEAAAGAAPAPALDTGLAAGGSGAVMSCRRAEGGGGI